MGDLSGACTTDDDDVLTIAHSPEILPVRPGKKKQAATKMHLDGEKTNRCELVRTAAVSYQPVRETVVKSCGIPSPTT